MGEFRAFDRRFQSDLRHDRRAARRGAEPAGVIRVEGRPYTTIEMALARRMIEVILEDTQKAFEPLTQVTFSLERLESNPRFCRDLAPRPTPRYLSISGSIWTTAAAKIEILLPYATIEPIREQLLQMFMGEKFGRDPIWEGHLATEIFAADTTVNAILHEMDLPLR